MTYHAPDGPAPWYPPSAGPIAVLVHPREMKPLVRELRGLAGRHDDTAWLHPTPPADKDQLANVGQDLLDAIGAVGLTQPRSNGERHLLRPLVHLLHGPVRHLVIDDAAHLDPAVLTELHQACLLAHTHMWLLIDLADHAADRHGDQRSTRLLQWVNDTASVRPRDDVIAQWKQRPVLNPCCNQPDPTWWTTPLDQTVPLPQPCPDHTGTHAAASQRHPDTAEVPGARAVCLLAQLRRALTLGHAAPTIGRTRLNEYIDHADTTVADRWALTAAGRDFFTPGVDAARLIGDTWLRLAHVEPDASTITVGTTQRPVDPMYRPAITRLRSSRHLAGCLDTEGLAGVFDKLVVAEPHRPTSRPR